MLISFEDSHCLTMVGRVSLRGYERRRSHAYHALRLVAGIPQHTTSWKQAGQTRHGPKHPGQSRQANETSRVSGKLGPILCLDMFKSQCSNKLLLRRLKSSTWRTGDVVVSTNWGLEGARFWSYGHVAQLLSGHRGQALPLHLAQQRQQLPCVSSLRHQAAGGFAGQHVACGSMVSTTPRHFPQTTQEKTRYIPEPSYSESKSAMALMFLLLFDSV